MPVFMLKDIHHKSEIKAVLDHQLVNLRTYNIDPRALSHDKAGLRSTYSFEKAGNSRRSDEMLKTGQVPMDVNAMPGLVLEESDDEEKDIWGDVNAMQGGEACYFCKKTKHQKRDCRKYKEWKKKTQTGSEEVPTGSQFSVIIVERMVKSHENAGERGIIGEKRMEL